MKKMIALLMALMLLCTAALAEETMIPSESMLQYEAMVETVPEGWTLDRIEAGSHIVMTMYRDTDVDAVYLISISPSEPFAGYTLSAELSDKEIANMEEMLTADYNDAELEILVTEHGTAVVCINENGAETDQAELITIWNGYFIGITVVKHTEITEEDLAVGMKLMSDLWVFNNLQ